MAQATSNGNRKREIKAHFMHFSNNLARLLNKLLFIVLQDAYAEPGQDSRNIAGIDIVIIVEDVQDVAPVFTMAPPVTRLPSGLIPGDKVNCETCPCCSSHLIISFIRATFTSSQILQVHAEDGDKGVPREIRYGLVSEGNPFTSFFDINDTTGES